MSTKLSVHVDVWIQEDRSVDGIKKDTRDLQPQEKVTTGEAHIPKKPLNPADFVREPSTHLFKKKVAEWMNAAQVSGTFKE